MAKIAFIKVKINFTIEKSRITNKNLGQFFILKGIHIKSLMNKFSCAEMKLLTNIITAQHGRCEMENKRMEDKVSHLRYGNETPYLATKRHFQLEQKY